MRYHKGYHIVEVSRAHVFMRIVAYFLAVDSVLVLSDGMCFAQQARTAFTFSNWHSSKYAMRKDPQNDGWRD
ncbi:hypothetical protein M378DRAFT_165492 [Amanita muscaria Koide BX008]|uniref:Uncharacterized protein n=1 Tax=Amanita muscaria (strain Koide BX008) TaxID=946122 RepID=A0A0C2T7S2_AMAMK|nr:hypothetical protein M378DRAFT_165492 [Amanita muscaria Koide BX008]